MFKTKNTTFFSAPASPKEEEEEEEKNNTIKKSTMSAARLFLYVAYIQLYMIETPVPSLFFLGYIQIGQSDIYQH